MLLPQSAASSAPHARVLSITGNGSLSLNAVAADSQRNIYVAGAGRATAIPGLERGFQTRPDGQDALVAKLSPRGDPIWATDLGGTDFQGTDVASSIAVDAAGH